jgi:hypothetical protein
MNGGLVIEIIMPEKHQAAFVGDIGSYFAHMAKWGSLC